MTAGEISSDPLVQLMETSGFDIVQENGQRYYGFPPPNWSGPAPPKGSEVFVGRLPRNLFEDELIPLFCKIGSIYGCRLMMDFCGSNRGYAFITFTEPSSAHEACKQLDDYEIRPGKRIGVMLSVDNCRLFVGGIPKSKTKAEIMQEMQRLAHGVLDVIVYSSVTDKSKNRGFAFVEFTSHKSAAMARRKLLPGPTPTNWGISVAVDWAEPEPFVDDATMSKVKVLYVRNLMLTTSEDTIKKVFSQIATQEIEKVKKLRDFAFVHFATRQDAEIALNNLNGINLEGTSIEVMWAKPADKISKPKRDKNSNNHMSFGLPEGHPMRQPSMFARRGRGRGAAGMRGSRLNSFNNPNLNYGYFPYQIQEANYYYPNQIHFPGFYGSYLPQTDRQSSYAQEFCINKGSEPGGPLVLPSFNPALGYPPPPGYYDHQGPPPY